MRKTIVMLVLGASVAGCSSDANHRALDVALAVAAVCAPDETVRACVEVLRACVDEVCPLGAPDAGKD